MNLASIGLKAKTGSAVAVVLGGSAEAPQVLKRAELVLIDPGIPATSQPYHEVMDLPWDQAQVAVEPFINAIEEVATEALGTIVRELRLGKVKIAGVGIAGAPDRRLEKIGNPHIRAHAAEGVLFRRVLESAAKANGLRKRKFVEKTLAEQASLELGWTAMKLSSRLAGLGSSLGPPWRTDQRSAAMAAWMMLISERRNR